MQQHAGSPALYILSVHVTAIFKSYVGKNTVLTNAVVFQYCEKRASVYLPSAHTGEIQAY